MDQRDRGYFNASMEDFQPKRDPLYIVLPMTFLYTCIFVTGVVGNISTCIVISRNKHMHTATNYYLFSLAISDLLLLVSGLPQEMYLIWSRYPYVFGEPFCLLRGLAAETSANATVLTITAFTVERYVAICHPFLAHTISKLSRAVKFIIAIWIIALASAIPQALQFGLVNDGAGIVHCGLKRILIAHAFELSTFLFFLLPMTLITVLYALIGLRLRKSSVVSRESGGSFGHTDAGRKGPSPHRHHCSRRVLKMLVAVVVAFFICWAPFHAQRLFYIYYNVHPIPPMVEQIYAIVTYISGILYYLSTTINPILYHIMSLKFREAFKTTVAKCCFNERRTRPYLTLSRGKTEPDSGKSGTDTAVATNQEDQVFCRRCPNDISNSSLRRLDEGGLEDELTSYMKELEQRQTS